MLDAVAAPASLEAIDLTPLLLLFDFAAAFPSLGHAFFFLALRQYKVPEGLYQFIAALYTDNKCYAVFDGPSAFFMIY